MRTIKLKEKGHTWCRKRVHFDSLLVAFRFTVELKMAERFSLRRGNYALGCPKVVSTLMVVSAPVNRSKQSRSHC